MVPARTLSRIAAIVAAALLVACGQEAAKKDNSAADRSTAQAAEQAFAQEQQRWRDERRAALLAPDGWTSLIGLHWIAPGSHFVGSAGGSGIRLAMGPSELGMLVLRKDGTLAFTPARGATLTLDDRPFGAVATLRNDADPAGPSRIGFDDGKGVATVIERSGRHALRVKHADAPSRARFAGLAYWPSSLGWQLQARFVPHPQGRTLPIANIIGTIEDTPNPGAVEFVRNGARFRLEALDEGDGQLFLVFADRTNGHGSYGAGRFLDAGKPDAQGRVLLDFNRSYNPPCAFTAFATCPLPPPQNRLDLAVEAGEKAYAGDPH